MDYSLKRDTRLWNSAKYFVIHIVIIVFDVMKQYCICVLKPGNMCMNMNDIKIQNRDFCVWIG
jgi:hypothetical protein